MDNSKSIRSRSSSASDCDSCDGGSSYSSLNDQRPSSERREEIMERMSHEQLDDEMREFYTRRVQSLERFRQKTTELCTNECTFRDKDTGVFVRLQSDMVSLMESDVSLTRQLMALAEQIEHLKMVTNSTDIDSSHSTRCLSTASSMISLDGIDQEDLKTIDEASITIDMAPLALSSSDEFDDLDETILDKDTTMFSTMPSKQYFARQNSILRIPIRPNRRRSKAQLDFQNSKNKKCNLERASTASSSDGDGTTSTFSSLYEIAKKKSYNNVDRVRMKSTSLTDQTRFSPIHHHTSQGSCDSGVHNLNSSGDFDKEDTVFV